MTFPLGKPIAVMIVVALTCAAVIATRRAPAKTDMIVWTFTENHARAFREGSGDVPALTELYRSKAGKSVDIKLMGGQALMHRLGSIFDRSDFDGEIPDLVEIEVNAIPRFFRVPTEQMGLLPLNDFIARSGFGDRLLPARLALWSKGDVIFGIPHDVHPMTLSYRKDLWDAAGVDPTSAKTWTEFHQLALRFQSYWTAQGLPQRRAIELPTASTDMLLPMLLQRHINPLDEKNNVTITDPRVAGTIAFYARCVAGKDRIAADATPGPNVWVRDFARGDLCSTMTPDWRAAYIKSNAPELAGKVAMMPLPVFEAGDAPTSTLGGTMIGIPRHCKDPQASWKLIEFLYYSSEGLAARNRTSRILAPDRRAWDDPVWHEADPYFGGQKIGELYIRLAEQIPARRFGPYTTLASAALTQVMTRAIDAVDSENAAALEPQIQAWLEEAATEIRWRIEFGKVDE